MESNSPNIVIFLPILFYIQKITLAWAAATLLLSWSDWESRVRVPGGWREGPGNVQSVDQVGQRERRAERDGPERAECGAEDDGCSAGYAWQLFCGRHCGFSATLLQVWYGRYLFHKMHQQWLQDLLSHAPWQCHKTMVHGLTQLESSGILGIEHGIALSV